MRFSETVFFLRWVLVIREMIFKKGKPFPLRHSDQGRWYFPALNLEGFIFKRRKLGPSSLVLVPPCVRWGSSREKLGVFDEAPEV